MNDNTFQIFARLTKVDEASRQVTGIIASETPDKSGEVMDYSTSKPNFVKWSGDMAKASGGKNVGNVRVMHGLTAAGMLKAIDFRDDDKNIEATASIVDDDEWKKVLAGVYTGFSVGGRYAKRWKDGDLQRYTAVPHEVSLVDAPCIPDATFSLVKADGATENRAFAKPEVSPFAEVMAKIAARSDVKPSEGESKYGNVAYADEKNKKYPIDTPEHIRAAWNYINKQHNASKYGDSDVASIKKKIVSAWKHKIDASGPPSAEKDSGDMAKAAFFDCAASILVEKLQNDTRILEGINLAKSITRGAPLAKDLCTVSTLAGLLQQLGWMHASVAGEARFEDDGSPLPADLAEAVTEIGRILTSMVEEEVSELEDSVEDQQMALAAQAEELRKSLSTKDEDLQKALGAAKEAESALAKMQGANDELLKTVAARELRIAELEKAAKAPAVMAVGKGDDVVVTTQEPKFAKVYSGDGQVDPVATVLRAIQAAGGQKIG